MQIKVSIIVPVYNVEGYLEECIESVLNQSFSSVELLLIDDGSLDGSSLICDSFAQVDTRIRVFHIENHGVSFARNFGLLQAKGKYVYFLDADDKLPFNAIDSLYRIIAENNCSYVKGNHLCLCNHVLHSSSYTQVRSNYSLKRVDNITFLLKVMRREFYSWNILYERDFLIENHIEYPNEISMCEDTLFLLKMFLAKTSYGMYINQPTYILRIRENSASASMNVKKIDDFLFVMSKIKEIYSTVDNKSLRKELLKILSTGLTFIVSAVSSLPGKQRYEYLKYLKRFQSRVVLCGNIAQILKALLYNVSPSFLSFLLSLRK